jgi:putative YhdH/YhfP family quinone oxidoreductase
VEGDVTIDVEWSCCNFKDAMAAAPRSRVARRSPLIGGVDAAGTVTASQDPSIGVGTRVVAHGHGFGTSHHGGFAERLTCPGSWLLALPDGLDTRTAMIFGTAGYTAMASVLALEHAGLRPDRGEVLVTGAAGGVGSVSVALLAARGFEVVAMTGRPDEHAYLSGLGAARIIGRDGLANRPDRVLGEELFAGAVDCVGGETLARILRSLRWGGAVAASGLVGGAAVETTVYPFITRNVTLLGIDSVEAPRDVREAVWRAIAGALDAATCEAMVDREIGLEGIATALADLDRGAVRGRVLVRPSAA